jgi:hypothetical protein
MTEKMYATTHVCKLHTSFAHINQVAQTERVNPKNTFMYATRRSFQVQNS